MIAGAVLAAEGEITVGLTDPQGRVLARRTLPSNTAAPVAPHLAVSAALTELADARPLVGIGVAFPDGQSAPPWAEPLSQTMGLKCHLLSSSAAAGVAEQHFGVGGGDPSLLLVSVGETIGGALIIGGRAYEGARGQAGAVGHIVVTEHGPQCRCGHRGCVQSVASVPAVLRRTCGAGLEISSITDLFTLAREGDAIARWMMAEAGKYLGRALAVCQNLFDPALIVVRGAMAPGLDLLHPHIEKVMSARALQLPGQPPRIVTGRLGDDAALIGAAATCFLQ